MTAAPLFYVSPEWDRQGRLLRHSLVWNALDGHHEKIASWEEAFKNRRPLANAWQPPVTMLEKSEGDADFVAACSTTFAVKPAAWKLIADLAQATVEALPVQVTHLIDPAKFDFPAIPAKKQPSYLLLHGLFNLPMRHGQHGYWDVDKSRYDVSMGKWHGASPDRCQVLWLDPEEFAGKHLFLLEGEWVASAEFVERIRAKKLSGLVFHPIKYEAKPRPASPRLKTMPEPPRPDFAGAAKGFSPKLGEQWLALWDWSVTALKNRGWPARKPRLKPPLPEEKLLAFEAKHNIKLPRDYADVLTKFASEVTVDLGWVEPGDPPAEQRAEIERRLQELMFGGKLMLWSFEFPMREYAGFKKSGDSYADAEPDSAYGQHFRNKLPVLGIRNGDYITLDLVTGVPTYISHDGDARLQGKALGKSFVDFITRWSWACLPWPDFLPGTAFYDKRSETLSETSAPLAIWHAWLRAAPLPPDKG
jgi:hypothetical protein